LLFDMAGSGLSWGNSVAGVQELLANSVLRPGMILEWIYVDPLNRLHTELCVVSDV